MAAGREIDVIVVSSSMPLPAISEHYLKYFGEIRVCNAIATFSVRRMCIVLFN